MKENFKCPRCRTMQSLGKRLHASWECPHCHNTIIPNKQDRMFGYRPFKYNSMVKAFSTLRTSVDDRRFKPKYTKYNKTTV